MPRPPSAPPPSRGRKPRAKASYGRNPSRGRKPISAESPASDMHSSRSTESGGKRQTLGIKPPRVDRRTTEHGSKKLGTFEARLERIDSKKAKPAYSSSKRPTSKGKSDRDLFAQDRAPRQTGEQKNTSPRHHTHTLPTQRGNRVRSQGRRAASSSVKTEGPQRIAKLMARAGVASRRDIERMIAEGRIALKGEVLTTPATLLTSLAGVTVDGIQVEAAEVTRIWRFHKPTGCLTTAYDPAGRPTVFDLLPEDLPRLLSIGRLDYNTEGLLLFTNDGALKRAFELPSSGIERRYRVRVRGELNVNALSELAEGITIDGLRYGSIIADIEHSRGMTHWLFIRLAEGKNREVRKVMGHLGLDVTRLIRVGYGPFELDDLPSGEIEELDATIAQRFVTAPAGACR